MIHSNIILVGFMGAGKTAIGKRLAQRLQFQFIDVDREIEILLKMPIPLIFKKHGVIRFRSEEELMIMKLCRQPRLIISTGGGVVLKETNRHNLKRAGIVIWLEASAEQILKRVGLGQGRPLLKGKDVQAVVSQLLAEREILYQDVAHFKIDTNNKSIEQITSQIFVKLKDEYNEQY